MEFYRKNTDKVPQFKAKGRFFFIKTEYLSVYSGADFLSLPKVVRGSGGCIKKQKVMSDFRLKVFRSAARHLSFTKASEELYVSQPSVTRHIRELETEYGQRLFERTGGRLQLTRAGERMLEHVERILEAYSALEYEMKKMSGELGGTLRIGASTTIAQYVLPRALALFSQDRRQTSIYLRNGNTEEIEQALLAHEIDLGLVEGGSRQRVLNYIPFMKDELVAVVRTDNRLNLPEELSVSDLAAYPLVLREQGSGTLDVLSAALSARGIPLSSLQSYVHLGSTESIKRFLLYTDSIGFVSIRAVRDELATGKLRLIELRDLSLFREFSVVSRQGNQSGPAADFVDFLMKNVRQLM